MKTLLRPLKKTLHAFMKSRSVAAGRVNRFCVALHQQYENLDYDLETNGEKRVLKRLAEVFQADATFFDVGANKGDWSKSVADLLPRASIEAFEIIPQTFQILVEALQDRSTIRCHNVGLSDQDGEVQVFFSEADSAVATAVPGFVEKYHGIHAESITAKVTTGDQFCRSAGISTIDLLKIDVEGYEDRVLRGFESLLRHNRVKAIQFEYGRINIDTHFLLKDFYDYLQPFGMVIGKIFPTHVDFREYHHEHEDFLGPNYLAVHKSCDRHIALLGAK